MSGNGRPPDEKATKDDDGRINALQIAAATCASATAAVVAEALGIYGTIFGVAVFSVISSVATVLFLKSMHRTKDTIGKVVKARGDTVTAVRAPAPDDEPKQPGRSREFMKRNWKAIALSSLIVFVLSVGVLTAIALLSGKPASTYYDSNPHEPTSTHSPEPSDGSVSDDGDSSGGETSSGDDTPSESPEGSDTPDDSPDASDSSTEEPQDGGGSTGEQDESKPSAGQDDPDAPS